LQKPYQLSTTPHPFPSFTMLRRFLLPLLGLALFTTEAASAQTTPAAKPVAGAYNRPVARAGRTLTAREKRAAEAAAKAEALAAAKQAAAEATASANATSGWSGWSDAPLQATEVGNGQHRPSMNVSVAPGMPLNQVGHGVSTDYNGRPVYREATSTTLSNGR
jgi:membrane protein involved in colicin uptake